MIKTLRAGARKEDPHSSGYVRTVGIIGQEDLFPKEGYTFPNVKPKITNSYRVSDDSPFSTHSNVPVGAKTEEQHVIDNSYKQMIRNERLCTVAAVSAIAAPSDGELRKYHSKIVQQAVMKERKHQMVLKEQLKMARMKDEAHWTEVEQAEAATSKAMQDKENEMKRAAEKNLARIYQHELALHDQRKKEEAALEKEEARKIAELQRIDNERDREERERKRQENKKRMEEAVKGNMSLLERKKRLISEQKAEEERIQQQHIEAERKQAEREQLIKQARIEKDKYRERLIDAQTKRLAEEKAKEEHAEAVMESQLEKLYQEQKQKEADRKKRILDDVRASWKLAMEMKEKRKAEELAARRAPLPVNTEQDEMDAVEAKMRQMRRKKVREIQEQQMEERRERMKSEAAQDREMANHLYFLKDEDL